MFSRSVLAWLAPASPPSTPSRAAAVAAVRSWKVIRVAPLPWLQRRGNHSWGRKATLREMVAGPLPQRDVGRPEPAPGRVCQVRELLEGGERQALLLERGELGARERPGDAVHSLALVAAAA